MVDAAASVAVDVNSTVRADPTELESAAPRRRKDTERATGEISELVS